MRRKLPTLIVIGITVCLTAIGLFIYTRFAAIPELVRMNGQLKAEGYYMGEFEFKFLGIAYYIDKGQYRTALTRLQQLKHQLESREGLIKIPEFHSKKEELEFYLNLQNPKTGAFMDEQYPLFTYTSPTLNMLEHLESLANQTSEPLRLKYPLAYLGQINTPETLKAYLEDVSSVSWLVSKLPKTPYIGVTEIIDYPELERHHLYFFSPEWKHSLVEWYYNHQDLETGFWGPKLRNSGKLLNSGELGSTYHIAKLFVDDQGNDRYPEFPLQYKQEMLESTLRKLAAPMPEDLAELHDWSLTRVQGIKMITNFLWKEASPSQKILTREMMKEIIKIKFEYFYIPKDGAFSLYAGSEAADLDGTDLDLFLLKNAGAFSQNRREYLWGPEMITDLGKGNDFTVISSLAGVNSLRLYRSGTTAGTDNVFCIVYPKETKILDVLDLLPKITHWAYATPQNTGNWVSKGRFIQDLKELNISPVPVVYGQVPTEWIREKATNNQVTVIAFDILQTPIYKMTLTIP